MRISTSNVGLALAVVAGVAALGRAVWPGSAPQAETLNFWLPLTVLSGCAFLVAAIVADHHTALARGLLAIGGLGLVASAVYFGFAAGGGGRSTAAVVVDLLPGLLALVSAVTIGRVQRGAIP
ncbi:MAG: hypothetical protein M3336_14840 [Chloroflexota bacterium]|nr:hypothetical protein [Chloroflexota bacterium]